MDVQTSAPSNHCEDILAHLQMAEDLIERATARLEVMKADAIRLEKQIDQVHAALTGNQAGHTNPNA